MLGTPSLSSKPTFTMASSCRRPRRSFQTTKTPRRNPSVHHPPDLGHSLRLEEDPPAQLRKGRARVGERARGRGRLTRLKWQTIVPVERSSSNRITPDALTQIRVGRNGRTSDLLPPMTLPAATVSMGPQPPRLPNIPNQLGKSSYFLDPQYQGLRQAYPTPHHM